MNKRLSTVPLITAASVASLFLAGCTSNGGNPPRMSNVNDNQTTTDNRHVPPDNPQDDGPGFHLEMSDL